MQQSVYLALRLFYRCFFSLCYRLEISGAEHLDKVEGALIASSHASFFDPPLIACSAPHPVHFLARESLFQVWILGALIRRLNTHPIQGTSSAKSIRTVVDLIKEGSQVVIFPEGSRSIDGSLQPIERGMSLIVSRAECPIIPCYIDGAYEAWGRHRRFPKPWGKIRVAFGEPIPFEQFASLDRHARHDAVCEATEKALRSLQ